MGTKNISQKRREGLGAEEEAKRASLKNRSSTGHSKSVLGPKTDGIGGCRQATSSNKMMAWWAERDEVGKKKIRDRRASAAWHR